MANGNKLYSAYRGAGKASSTYKASLYDIENLGIERESSQAMFQFEQQQRERTLSTIQMGIGLASDIYGGIQSKKKAKEDRSAIQKSMAEKGYTPGEDGKSFSDLSLKQQEFEMAKYSPIEQKRTLGEILTGGEKSFVFGEGGESFTSAQITAGASQLNLNTLSELTGTSTTSKPLDILTKEITESIDKKNKSEESKIIKSSEPDVVKVEDVFTSENNDDSVLPTNNVIPKVKPKPKPKMELKNLEEDEKKDSDKFKFNFNMDFGSSMGAESTYKSFAKGGEYITNGPELIMVGDNPGGKEKVTVKPIKSKKKEQSEGQQSLADSLGSNLKKLVSKKGTKPGSNKWINNYIQSQKMGNESLRPLKGQLAKHNKKLLSMAEESGYFGEFFRGGWE